MTLSDAQGRPKSVSIHFVEHGRSLRVTLRAVSACAVRLLYCGDIQTSGARVLRDSGHEVVLLEPGVSADQLAAVAVQEDVDVVAVADADLGAGAVHALGDDVVVFWITSASGHSSPSPAGN